MWTTFWDMHSGGSQKEKWSKGFIEAPEGEAVSVFYARFGHNPNRVTCTCCGEDYSISENETLAKATAFHRNCEWDKVEGGYVERPRSDYGEYMTLDEYIASDDVMVIYASDITANERTREVPQEGYVWV